MKKNKINIYLYIHTVLVHKQCILTHLSTFCTKFGISRAHYYYVLIFLYLNLTPTCFWTINVMHIFKTLIRWRCLTVCRLIRSLKTLKPLTRHDNLMLISWYAKYKGCCESVFNLIFSCAAHFLQKAFKSFLESLSAFSPPSEKTPRLNCNQQAGDNDYTDYL